MPPTAPPQSAASTPRRLATMLVSLVLLLAMVGTLPSLTDHLSWGGWIPDGAESVRVDERLASEFDRRASSHLVLITPAEANAELGTVTTRRELARITSAIREIPGVTAAYTPLDAPTAALRTSLAADDGSAWLVVIQVDDALPKAITHLPDIETAIASDTLDTRLTGVPALSSAFGHQVKADLMRAELLALPLALLLLIRFAGGWRAAVAIIITTITALAAAIVAIAIAGRVVSISMFAVSIVAILAIALSLDFGLLAALRGSSHAATRHIHLVLLTAGAAVIAGMAGLALIPVDAARSIGIAGMVAVAIVVLCQRWLLPTWFAILDAGHRRKRDGPATPSRLLTVVGQHPLASLIIGMALLVPIIAPVAKVDLVGLDIGLLDRTTPAAGALDDITNSFPAVPVTPITVIVSPVSGSMYNAGNLFDLKQTVNRIEQLPGIEDVRSVWDLVPGGISSPVLTATFALDPTLAEQARPLVTDTGAVIEITAAPGAGPQLVELIRSEAARLGDGDLRMQVGGVDAASVDLVTSVGAISIRAVIAVTLATIAVLAVAFRSVVLPLKAIALNALPVLAGLGAVTWLFQLGTPWSAGSGSTVILVPLVLAWLMFGISMDYEVFMLARIREERDHGYGNRQATLRGVERARAVVARGATLMAIVFLAFAISDIHVVRAIGVGLFVAIVIDATVIRLILLPASMVLLGRWNWWWLSWRPTRTTREPAILPERVPSGDR